MDKPVKGYRELVQEAVEICEGARIWRWDDWLVEATRTLEARGDSQPKSPAREGWGVYKFPAMPPKRDEGCPGIVPPITLEDLSIED